MRISSPLALLLLACCSLGCGKEIGDECVISQDCSPNGDRQCDVASKEGYCTVQGCDASSCPEEAVCVRFFTGSFANKQCNRRTEDQGTDHCSFDELCSLTAEDCDPSVVVPDTDPNDCGRCVPRSSEIRFCMRRCESGGDCRDGYECRDLELMKAHGGEVLGGEPASFCATAPSAS